jgi:hypothetical protein
MENKNDESDSPFERSTLRWPQTGDQLLINGRHASIYPDKGERNYRLLRGYKFAGDLLVQQALADHAERNNLIFPALFSYRHYIELALKAAILEHGPFAGVLLDKPNHNLDELWKKFLQVAEKFQCSPTDEAAVAVGECVAELSLIDGNSIAFRYAADKRGALPPLPAGLDLANLHDVMNGIENFCECAELDFQHKTAAAYENMARDLE